MANPQTSLRLAGWVSVFAVGQLVVQFALQVLLAKYFGAEAEMDAFVAAISLPTVVSAVLFSSLGYAIVPVISQKLASGDTAGAWLTASSLLSHVSFLTCIAASAMSLLAWPLVGVLFPGFSGVQTDVTARLLSILSWLVVTNWLITFSQAVHHSHRRFLTPAAAPIVGTGATVLLTLTFHDRGVVSVAWAVLAGSGVAAAIQLVWPLRFLRPQFRLEADTRRLLRLCLPLVCGAAYCRLDPLVDRYLASVLPTGSVSHLGYAARLVTALLLVSSSGLAVVAFPNFVRQQASPQKEDLATEVSHALRCLVTIVVPIVVGLGCFAGPVVHDVFQRGKFRAEDTRAVAVLLTLYLGMIVAAAFGEVLAKVFYAISDTRTPTIIGCIGFTLGWVAKVAFVASLGVAAIAIATSCYYLLTSVLMGWFIRKRFGRQFFAGVGAALARSLVAAIISVLVAAPLVLSRIPASALVGAVGGAVAYFLVLLLERDEMARRLRDFGWERLRGQE